MQHKPLQCKVDKTSGLYIQARESVLGHYRSQSAWQLASFMHPKERKDHKISLGPQENVYFITYLKPHNSIANCRIQLRFFQQKGPNRFPIQIIVPHFLSSIFRSFQTLKVNNNRTPGSLLQPLLAFNYAFSTVLTICSRRWKSHGGFCNQQHSI